MHCNLSQQALRAVQWVRWQSTHCVRESWGLCTARHGCTCGACRPWARWSPSVARAIGRSPSRRVIPAVVRHEQLGPCSNPAVVRHQQLGRSPAAFRLRRLSQRRRAMYTWHRFQHCWIRQAAKCWQRWHAASTSHRRVLQSNLQRRRLVQRPRAPARVRQSANLLGIRFPPLSKSPPPPLQALCCNFAAVGFSEKGKGCPTRTIRQFSAMRAIAGVGGALRHSPAESSCASSTTFATVARQPRGGERL
jgi:hypothetical protein